MSKLQWYICYLLPGPPQQRWKQKRPLKKWSVIETSTCIMHIRSNENQKRFFDRVWYSIWFVCPYLFSQNSKPASQAWGPASQAWGPASQAWGPASQAWGSASQAWGPASHPWSLRLGWLAGWASAQKKNFAIWITSLNTAHCNYRFIKFILFCFEFSLLLKYGYIPTPTMIILYDIILPIIVFAGRKKPIIGAQSYADHLCFIY